MGRRRAHGINLLLGLLVVGALGVGGWWLASGIFARDSDDVGEMAAAAAQHFLAEEGMIEGRAPSGAIVDAAIISSPAEPLPGHIKYVNERYGFSFYHSPQGKITEYDEGQGAMTIVLENEQRVRGMQIFIVPYNEPTISDERFRADVPSGVRENVEMTTLGVIGIPAVTFTSLDERLGETREIWFIYRGHLYEITTFKGVGNWFAPIIQSWRFTP